MSVTIKQRILTNNDCYKSGRTITPNSMQLHTIGTAQNTAESLAQYWNQPGIQACVQYCIDAEKPGLVYQFLPDNRRPWADAGYGNNNSIAVELMESDYMKYTGGANYTITDEAKFKADITRAYNTAVEFFAMKCKEYGWNPKEKMANGLHRVYSHDEGRRLGLSSSHVDPTHIWNRYGWTMDKFREDVANAMNGTVNIVAATLYRVRKSWADEKSQIFAGTLEGAKRAAVANPGYYVYDEAGKLVYGTPDAISSAASTGTQAKSLNGLSEADKIKRMAPLYQKVAKETGMLASVGLAQFCLESGYGTTDLAQNANNLHGMKCSLSNNDWPNTSWDGKSKYGKKTKEQDPTGKEYEVYAYFRKYPCIEDSIKDRAAYFLGAMNGTKKRYPGIGNLKTAEEQIKAIKAGGYATDVNYVSKLMNIVNRFNLTQYDPAIEWYRVATDYKSGKYVGQIGAYTDKNNAIETAKKSGSGYKVYSQDGQVVYSAPVKTEPKKTTTVKAKDIYAVRRALNKKDSQIGLFSDINNARKLADERWGFNVYNIETNKPVYKPVLMNWQKVCASAIELGEEVLKDIAAGHAWEYAGSGERTFAKAREKGNYKVNCSGGVYWILRNAGVIPSSYSCNWYGTIGGFKWLTPTAEAEARKYFDIIDIHNKTVNQCIKDGTLHPGDIICYETFSHTNMYLGNNTSFDSGHNNCHGSGNGAKFYRWVSPLTCGGYKIAQIMRIKENVVTTQTTSVQYRVQAGEYMLKDNANNMLTKVKKAGFDAKIVTVNGMYIVQLGVFSVKSNADALVTKAAKAGIVCIANKI